MSASLRKPALPLLRFKYYRPDPWLPEVAHRCDLCGQWVAKIGDPERIVLLELHVECPSATPDALEKAREIARRTQ